MRFFIVHELETSEGVRLRARADRHFSLSEAEGLADALDAVEGVEGVRVNPLVGSVLLLFLPEARERVLSALAAEHLLEKRCKEGVSWACEVLDAEKVIETLVKDNILRDFKTVTLPVDKNEDEEQDSGEL